MESSRRAFLEIVPAWLAAAAHASGAAAGGIGRAMEPDAGELCFVGPNHDPVRLKVARPADTTALSMIVQDVSPGTRIPVHLHEREDEIILVQSGSGTATLADSTVPVTAGSVLWVPRGTWHGGANTGTGVLKWTGIYSPAGFEGYFREISTPPGAAPRHRSPQDWEALDRQYGIRYRR